MKNKSDIGIMSVKEALNKIDIKNVQVEDVVLSACNRFCEYKEISIPNFEKVMASMDDDVDIDPIYGSDALWFKEKIKECIVDKKVENFTKSDLSDMTDKITKVFEEYLYNIPVVLVSEEKIDAVKSGIDPSEIPVLFGEDKRLFEYYLNDFLGSYLDLYKNVDEYLLLQSEEDKSCEM